MTDLTDMGAKENIAGLQRGCGDRAPGGNRACGDPRSRSASRHTRRPASLARALRDLDMPRDEVREVLRANDPVVVARYMELHRERLAEHLVHRVRELEALERSLARRSRVAAR